MAIVKRRISDPTSDYDIAAGSAALVAGAATIVTGLSSVLSFSVDSNTANRAFATASGGTLTVTGTGTDTVYWTAVGTI